MRGANTANEALTLGRDAGLAIADDVAASARATAAAVFGCDAPGIDIVIIDRQGTVVGTAGAADGA